MMLIFFIDSILIIEFREKYTYTFCYEINKLQYQYKRGDKSKSEQTKQL